MRYDADHKAETRATVVAEAAKAIRAEGPHRVGVAEIMARAGLTHGGFYAHFASKDDLIVAAIESMFEDAMVNFERRTAGKSPADALRAYIDWYLSPEHRNARESGCPLASISADLPRLGNPARLEFAAGYAALTAAISGLLTVLRFPEPDTLARSVLAELAGALSLARSVANPAQSLAILEASSRSLRLRLGLAEHRDGFEHSTQSPGQTEIKKKPSARRKTKT
jgi:TetR/AcrR family transcriptional regulator, transcriptional repressor for nem operon